MRKLLILLVLIAGMPVFALQDGASLQEAEFAGLNGKVKTNNENVLNSEPPAFLLKSGGDGNVQISKQTFLHKSIEDVSVQVSKQSDEVNLENVETKKIEIPKTDVKMKGSLVISDEITMQELVKLQKEKDVQDIENLWKGTVENNQVIGFALKKLATPESQRRIHSSLMAKTLNAVIAGASFAPMMTGSNYLVQSSAFAAGRLAQNLVNKKNIPQEIPLTDTELIELAGLIENLQDKIIDAYYNYKSSLVQLKETRGKLLLYNKNYSKALETNDLLEITISSSLYDNMALEEFYYMQSAKKYHLELQRMAGKKVLENLNLYQYNYNSSLLKGVEK